MGFARLLLWRRFWYRRGCRARGRSSMRALASSIATPSLPSRLFGAWWDGPRTMIARVWDVCSYPHIRCCRRGFMGIRIVVQLAFSVRVHWHGGPERGRPAWCVVANCSPLAVLQDCDAFPLVAIHQWYIEGVLSISSSFGPTIQLLPTRCCSRTLRVLSARAHGSTRPPGDRTASSAFAGSSIVGGQGDEQPLTVSTRAEAPPVPHLCGN